MVLRYVIHCILFSCRVAILRRVLELICCRCYIHIFFLFKSSLLCSELIRSKLKYGSIVWNNTTLIGFNRIGNIQRNFAS
jgi:hypothetical protein